ncbi:UNVERIFIED_CONTAM: hypothetical protein FKN15_036556 [Acipenser sinensis]
MAALRAAKQAMRIELKKRISQLSDQEKLRQSHIVTQKLIKHPKYQSCQRIAVFLSMHDEVQTEEIIEDIFQKGKVCFIPKYQTFQNPELHMLLCVTRGLDLILMPGLGFDKHGNRLGRGKGYYDTYLGRCMNHPKGKPYTIALAFKEQICDAIPVADNDIQVDEILYEFK